MTSFCDITPSTTQAALTGTQQAGADSLDSRFLGWVLTLRTLYCTVPLSVLEPKTTSSVSVDAEPAETTATRSTPTIPADQARAIFIKRILMTVFGVLGGGACVALFRMSVFGVDPFQAFMSGIEAAIPGISFGTLYVIVNLALLLFAFFTDRKKIGLGTFVNLFLLGYVIDFTHNFLLGQFPSVSMLGRIAFLATGIVIICIASSLYFTANLGVSTYDAVALVLSERLPRLPFKYWRIITDSICVLVGVALFLIGGNSFGSVFTIIGIGTIIAAFFMGPLIAFFNRKIAEPLLYGRSAKQVNA